MTNVIDITPNLDAKREADEFMDLMTELIESGQVTVAINEDGEYGLYPAE